MKCFSTWLSPLKSSASVGRSTNSLLYQPQGYLNRISSFVLNCNEIFHNIFLDIETLSNVSVTKKLCISDFLLSVIPALRSDFFTASQALKCHPCCSHPCTPQFLSKLLHSAAFRDVRGCPEALGISAGIKACL